ncbi:MAG: PaeR7I family type II restriction endonuclease [Actinobacteria bacterium]|nr:PaeR7I family type II restriction endonuclease [Actinomycetota bacterium]MCL5445279.1 PaeR7I family type II restriction endonuclease [Actinomycetota bacterium]
MANRVPDYEPRFLSAVRSFWEVRGDQAKRQRLGGRLDAGTRGEVTGGQHLNQVALLIADVFADAGIVPSDSSRLLPGYYRASKNWDVVVTHKGAIVAIIELKSQVGSFGNNFNNRTEEMIGQSLDLWRATREHLLGEVRPWFGYLMLLESREQSREIREHPKTAYPLDPEFQDTSYLDRYQIAFKRLRLEGDMNAVCLVTSDREQDFVSYPDQTMTFTAFATAIHGRVADVLTQLGK